MERLVNVMEIVIPDVEQVQRFLFARGCDGLWCDTGGGDACGCGLDDLAPCGELGAECVAARRGVDKLYHPVEVEPPAEGKEE